ncbi:MAG: cytochrome bc complex cytochrome b subunit [Nitrososphaerota archaeon]|nr:cytochrome bc complex cytochrome b subunit [Nitrososphaerota archaeon]
MSLKERFVGWWDDRLHLKDAPLARVPDYMYSFNYWTGSFVAAALVWQIVTGLFLILYYVPSDPYNQTMALIQQVPYGSLLLATHLYGAYAMIFLAYVHMFRNYFVKAYKKPRELQWMIGVLLLVIVQGASFLGYAMTGDILATDAVDVGKGIMSNFPGGNLLEPLFFGNGTSLSLFTRLLGYHIILVALIGLLFGYHFYLAEMSGFMPSRKKVNFKAPAKLDEKDPSLNPWYPRNLLYMVELSLFVFGFILIIPSVLSILHNVPLLFSPYPTVSPSSPLATTIPAYPPWFFLFLYKVLDFQPLSPFVVAVIAAIIPVLYFLSVPILDRGSDLHFLKGWVFQAIGVIAIINFIQTSVWAAIAPGVPVGPGVYVPVIAEPAVLIFVGFYLLSRRSYPSVTHASDSNRNTKFAFIALVLTAAVLSVVATLSINNLFSTGSIALLPPALTGSLVTGVLGVVVIGYRDGGKRTATLEVNTEKVAPVTGISRRPKLGVIYGIFTFLIVLSAILAVIMWSFNPITQAAFFGIGLGTLLILLAEMIAIYHYVSYSRG